MNTDWWNIRSTIGCTALVVAVFGGAIHTYGEDQVQVIDEGNVPAYGIRETTTCYTTREPCEPLKIIPSVACLWSTHLEPTLEGLRAWSRVTDSAIVTVRPGQADTFVALRAALPDMRFIPGLKTWELVQDLDSAAHWWAVALEIAALRQTSGSSIVLLENERTIERYMRGAEAIDEEQMATALSALPHDVTIMWRPIDWFAAGQAGWDRLFRLALIVQAAHPNVRFESLRYCDADIVTAQRYAEAWDKLQRFATHEPYLKLYFYGADHPDPWWLDEQLPEALRCVRGGSGPRSTVVIYTGQARFASAAPVLAGSLLRGCGDD